MPGADFPVSGQSGAVPASSERHGARFGGLRMRSGAPPETGKPAPSLGGRVCLDEGVYLHRQGPAGVSSQIMSPQCSAGVRVRSSQARVSRPCQLTPFVAQN